jgi:hypothetical protein
MEAKTYKHKCRVGGMEFKFYHISPRPLRSIFLKVVTKLAKSINPDVDLTNLSIDDPNGLSKMFNIKSFLENIDSLVSDKEIEDIENVLFSQCYCELPIKDGAQIKIVPVLDMYDKIFEDDFMASFNLLKEAFTCYYSNFLEKAKSLTNSNM